MTAAALDLNDRVWPCERRRAGLRANTGCTMLARMGARCPLVEIPAHLRRLLEHDAHAGLEQPAVAVRHERWTPAVGAHAHVVSDLPAELDRKGVRELVLAVAPTERGEVAGFIATQIWGYGATGYGPARLERALAYPDLPAALQAARRRLNDRDPVGALRVLCVEHRIPKVGMAFGSKYLYFADPHRRALILDQVIRDWLWQHAGVHLAGRRDEREYAVWLLLAEQWGSAAGVPPEKLDMIIFTDGLPEGSSWRPVERRRPTTSAPSENSRTRADAVPGVLETGQGGLRAGDVAEEISQQTPFRRPDGRSRQAYQLSSIARANPRTFQIAADAISRDATATTGEGPGAVASAAGVNRAERIEPPSPGSRVILLGCVKEKLDHGAPAKDLYRSRLWKARRAYAEASGLPWLILSAEHGVLEPDAMIAPYDVELRSLNVSARRSWGGHVVRALERRFGSLAGIIFEVHAGEAYRRAIEPGLGSRGALVDAPLAGLTIGWHPAWYRTHTPVGRAGP